MILLWGSMEDEPMAMARAALERAGADFFFLEHRKIFASEIDGAIGAGAGWRCTVTDGAAEFALQDVNAAYVRGGNLLDYAELEGRARDDPIAMRASGFELQLTASLDSSDALVVNRSDPSATNNSKPYQLTVIRGAGFRIPETFISNDSGAAGRFLSGNPDSIYKSVSGVRSIVRRFSDAHRASLEDVKWCPTLFQRVVPGTNYRAHVLNGEVLAVRIESGELDYRYARTTMVAAELPADVAQKCRRLNSMLGLHFSGIDLMRTPDDEWYCFEVNPSPGYSYFEQGSGQPISAALARLLIDADRGRGRP
ncbi:MAG: RimK domain-containing protein ATP-grasp [Opitutaceae bacterium]